MRDAKAPSDLPAGHAGLLPCPFCGGKETNTLATMEHGSIYYSVGCTNKLCRARVGALHSEYSAEERWNKRFFYIPPPCRPVPTPPANAQPQISNMAIAWLEKFDFRLNANRHAKEIHAFLSAGGTRPVAVAGDAEAKGGVLMGGDGKRWPATFDGVVWAKEFMMMLDQHSPAIDEALMLGWFANAIMVGYDKGRSLAPDSATEPVRLTPQTEAARELWIYERSDGVFEARTSDICIGSKLFREVLPASDERAAAAEQALQLLERSGSGFMEKPYFYGERERILGLARASGRASKEAAHPAAQPQSTGGKATT